MAMAGVAITGGTPSTLTDAAPFLHCSLHNFAGWNWSALPPLLSPPSAGCSPPLLIAACFSSSELWRLPEQELQDCLVAEHSLLAGARGQLHPWTTARVLCRTAAWLPPPQRAIELGAGAAPSTHRTPRTARPQRTCNAGGIARSENMELGKKEKGIRKFRFLS
jgi:hypothetical protein